MWLQGRSEMTRRGNLPRLGRRPVGTGPKCRHPPALSIGRKCNDGANVALGSITDAQPLVLGRQGDVVGE